MTSETRRILFCSRDVGSVQAMAPVAVLLGRRLDVHAHVFSMARSRHVLDSCAVAYQPLDEDALEHSPSAYLGGILDRVRPHLVVSGSSPARGPAPETPEQHLIVEARRRAVPSVAILDFWGMYEERFCNAGGLDLSLVPDVLCVLDETCRKDLLALGIPEERLRVTHNPWMDSVVNAPPPPRPAELMADALTILFVSQPLAENAFRGWGRTQNSLVNAIADALPAGREAQLLILPHPAEDSERWQSDNLPARPHLHVQVLNDFQPGVLAHCDFMVTSHSTMAYQAPYYDTPCLSLAIGGPMPDNFITNALGLSIPITTMEELRGFFAGIDPAGMRSELARCRRELTGRGIFFSDGNAAGRVCTVILEALADRVAQPL